MSSIKGEVARETSPLEGLSRTLDAPGVRISEETVGDPYRPSVTIHCKEVEELFRFDDWD